MTRCEYNRINGLSLKELKTLPDHLFFAWINSKPSKLRDGVKRFLKRNNA